MGEEGVHADGVLTFQDFVVGEILTAAKMDQVEANIRDHLHGQSSVVRVPHVGTEGPFTVHAINGGNISVERQRMLYRRGNDSTLQNFTVPTGLGLRIVNVEGFAITPTSAWLVNWELFNLTDTLATMIASFGGVTAAGTTFTVARSATAASALGSLGAGKRWTLAFNVLSASAVFGGDDMAFRVVYTYI